MITSYLKLSNCEIIKALSFSTNKKNQLAQKKLILSSQEYEKLKELQMILKDVFIFTELIQGDNVTISRLIPAVNTVLFNLRELKNINHLNSMKNKLIQGKQKLFIIKKKLNLSLIFKQFKTDLNMYTKMMFLASPLLWILISDSIGSTLKPNN